MVMKLNTGVPGFGKTYLLVKSISGLFYHAGKRSQYQICLGILQKIKEASS